MPVTQAVSMKMVDVLFMVLPTLGPAFAGITVRPCCVVLPKRHLHAESSFPTAVGCVAEDSENTAQMYNSAVRRAHQGGNQRSCSLRNVRLSIVFCIRDRGALRQRAATIGPLRREGRYYTCRFSLQPLDYLVLRYWIDETLNIKEAGCRHEYGNRPPRCERQPGTVSIEAGTIMRLFAM
jgi:hypothetical protein